MTRSDFQTLVKEYMKGGDSVIATSASATINAYINRGLAFVTRHTYCLYVRRQTLTTGDGTAEYSTTPIFDVDNVIVDGNPLLNRDRVQGPESLAWIRRRYPTYQTADKGKPAHFVKLPQNKIWLYPTPDGAYSNSFMSGFAEHAQINTGAGGDATELDITDVHVLDWAAEICAFLMEAPHRKKSGSILVALETERASLAQQLREYRRENMNKLGGQTHRQGRGRRLWA